MKKAIGLSFVFAGLLAAWVAFVPAGAQAQEAPKVAIPQSGVPQIMTMEGKFVRAAYNNEGYVILGYQVVNRSIGEEWVLLEIGATARDGVEAFKLMRGDFSLEIPDGKTIPLPTDSEVRAANTVALQNRTKVQRDSINYFPPSATRACRIGFFAELTSPVMAYDEVEISNTRACLGRLYFQRAGRHRVWPVLAQREVSEEPHPRAIPSPDRGRREDAVQELQGHQQAGKGRVQAAEEVM